MKLSTKVFLVLLPLFFAAVAVITYLNYTFQTQAALEHAKNVASTQALTIKESLVEMMTVNERVDDDYLARISHVGEVQNLEVWFKQERLSLRPEYLTADRLQRLRQRELAETGATSSQANKVFQFGKPVWSITCEVSEHGQRGIDVLSTEEANSFSSCDFLEAVMPVTAEQKCQRCHAVPVGHVLGAIHMEIPLAKSAAALRANAGRSIYVLLVFALVSIVLGAIIFRRYVSKPLRGLVQATEILGTGNLDYPIHYESSSDEFGKLSASFARMQQKLKHAQDELISKERLSVIGQMASAVVHDLRNPMSIIGMSVDLLQRIGKAQNEQIIKSYERIRLTLDRMNRMMQDLLDFSRGESRLNVRDCKVDDFVRDVAESVKPLLEQKGIRFLVQNQCTGVAPFDSDLLQRGLLNIINNAEDATPPGGEITFWSSCVDNLLLFQIQDSGDGIPDEVRDRLFELFVSYGKVRGTGLGLAVTKKIVEQHSGGITYESEQGRGTAFTIWIPIPEAHKHPRTSIAGDLAEKTKQKINQYRDNRTLFVD